MARAECGFCNPDPDKSVIPWQDRLFYSQIDAHPVSPGHALVIPKRHIRDLSGLNTEEWAGLRVAIENTIQVIQQTDLRGVYERYINQPISDQTEWFCRRSLAHPRINTKPDAYNHGINDGTSAGRTVEHLHWHIIPRYEGDVEDPRGGVRFVIPELGNYKLSR